MAIIGWCQSLKMGTVSLAALGEVLASLMTVLMFMSGGSCLREFATAMNSSLTYLNAVLPRHMGMTGTLKRREGEAGEITPQDLREQRLPGPFSFLAWLRYMSRNSSYANIHIMMATSMMWNIRLTLLYAESLKEVRFRHHKRITQADMVTVLCQDTEHIVSTGKFFVSGYAFFIRDRCKHHKNPWV